MMNRTLTAVALAAVLAAPALAQQQTPTTNMSPPPAVGTATSSTGTADRAGFVQQQDSADWRASQLISASVYGPDDKSIGSIDDVIIGSTGQIKAVVVGVGGFLGVGQKDVAVPLTALTITRKPNSKSIEKITASYSKDELKNAPKFAYYEPASSQTTGSSVNGTSKPMSPATPAPKH